MFHAGKKQQIIVLSLFLSIFLWNSSLHSQVIDNNQKSCLSHYVHSVQNIWDLSYQKTVYTAGFVAIPISFILDKPLKDYVQQHSLFSDQISSIGDFYGHRSSYYLALSSVFITGYLNNKSVSEMVPQAGLMIESILTTAALTELIKLSVYRQRPIGYGKNSFPSGHTSGAFALAVSINHIYGKTAGCLAYGMAVFVAGSRVNDQKHYLSDVVTGALIGVLVGRSFTRDHQNRICWTLCTYPKTIQIGINYPL